MSEINSNRIRIPIERLEEFDRSKAHSSATTAKDGSFGETLKSAIGEVDTLQKNADAALQDLVIGKGTDVHDVMIAAEKAAISFQLLMAIRSKMLEAYQEVMRMQV